MTTPVIYVYMLEDDHSVAPFTWPSVARKYIRDTYTVNGKLCLPPAGHLKLTRYKVNPKAGARIVADELDVGKFLSA